MHLSYLAASEQSTIAADGVARQSSQFTCPLCKKVFTRKDCQRRHTLKSCPNRRIFMTVEDLQDHPSGLANPPSGIPASAQTRGQEAREARQHVHSTSSNDEVGVLRERLHLATRFTKELRKQLKYERKQLKCERKRLKCDAKRTRELGRQLELEMDLREHGLKR